MKTPKLSVTTWANLLMDRCCPGLVTSLTWVYLTPKNYPFCGFGLENGQLSC